MISQQIFRQVIQKCPDDSSFFVQIQSKHDETGRPFVTSGVTGMSIRRTPTVAIASKGVCAGLAKIKIHSDGLRITELPLLQMQRPRCS